MKIWIMIVGLFVLGCSGGEPDSSAADSKTEGAEIADALNDAQDAAANVEVLLEEAKRDVDAAVEESEGTPED